jgi:hypothetical protein
MPSEVWDEAIWRPRRKAHTERVDRWLTDHRQRRSVGAKHPVEDFLFEYYSYRPYQLRRWHPGYGVALSGGAAKEMLSWAGYVRTPNGITVADSVVEARGNTLRWVHDLLVRTAERTPYFGCFGIHEWAMVYRLTGDERRHADRPLRLPAQRVAEVVEERGVRCSHVDAFRFFTPAARPLNVLQPTRATQPELEQAGCLHANMDLYKYAYKLSPIVPSDLVADAFALARDIRVLDMRASPYDLTALGLDPVPIETPEGRQAYAQEQRRFTRRSEALRQALVDLLARVLAETTSAPAR